MKGAREYGKVRKMMVVEGLEGRREGDGEGHRVREAIGTIGARDGG
jgi:hypothetical protein